MSVSSNECINVTGRHYFRDCRLGVGKMALASLSTEGLQR